jgi:hypothetical protein
MLMLTTGSIASAATVVCSKSVKACGCSITTTGVYTVQNNLSLGTNSDCISIGTKNVVLNLNGWNITGPGNGSTGAGVHIKNATSVWIEGQGTASQPSILSGWKYGVEDDGDSAFIENVTTTGNSKAGIYFFKANNSQLVNFTASGNSGYGVWLSSGGTDQVGNGSTLSNALDGVLIGCVGNGKGGCSSTGGNTKSNNIFGVDSENNGAGGITVQFNSDFNQIGRNTAAGNSSGDLLDKHSGSSCAHDLWFVNTGSVNKACVQ